MSTGFAGQPLFSTFRFFSIFTCGSVLTLPCPILWFQRTDVSLTTYVPQSFTVISLMLSGLLTGKRNVPRGEAKEKFNVLSSSVKTKYFELRAWCWLLTCQFFSAVLSTGSWFKFLSKREYTVCDVGNGKEVRSKSCMLESTKRLRSSCRCSCTNLLYKDVPTVSFPPSKVNLLQFANWTVEEVI